MTVWAIMVEVEMVAVLVALVVVVKVLVWEIVNTVVTFKGLVIDVLTDVEIVMVGAIVNILKFVLPISYSEDVPSDLDVDWFRDALMVGVLTGIGIEGFADVSVEDFAVVIYI